MRVLVCGGRDYTDRRRVFEVLDGKHAETPIATIIEGGALGADRSGYAWACARNIEVETYPADWEKHGKRAGPIRNAMMLTEGKPDLVIAFPGGRGTADMVRRAQSAGIPVIFPNAAD